jgi:hypothetical protein
MALRVQLINDKIGVFTIKHDDPIDINSVTRKIKRSTQHEGIMYEISIDIRFIKGGLSFLKQCYEQAGGIDAVVIINVYQLNKTNRQWEIWSTSQVDFNAGDFGEEDVIVATEQTGMQRRVLNMMELDVDLETEESENGTALPDQNVIVSQWHSKVIEKEQRSTTADGAEFQQLSAGGINFPATSSTVNLDTIWYGQIDNSNMLFDELDDSYNTPYGFLAYPNQFADDRLGGAGTVNEYKDFITTPPAGSPVRNPMLIAKEQGTTDVAITLKLKSRITASNTGGDVDVNGGSGVLGHCEVHAWIEHTDRFNVQKSLEHIGSWNMVNGVSGFETKFYNDGYEIAVGDKLYVFLTYRVYGAYETPTPPDGAGTVQHDLYIQSDPLVTSISFKSQTVTPETNVSSIMIYEAFERCLQYITNQARPFYSELLGRTDLGYAVDGEYSLISILIGNWLRGRRFDAQDNKIKLITNLKDLIDFVNSIACVGFGFKVIDGVQKFVLEKRSKFYDKDFRIGTLGGVYKPRKKVDSKRYFNMVEYGYSYKLDIATVNAIDEFNTLRRSIIPIINTKNTLKIATKVITGGYPIEYQRRLVGTTEDGTYDDEVFASVMIRDGESFKPKKNEGYEDITGIFDPASGYNFDISPGNTIHNWDKVIAASLIRSERKVVRFSYGTVNYRMTTKKDGQTIVYENADRDLTDVEPDYDPEIYVIEGVPITSELMKLIVANPYGYLDFIDRHGNLFEGFINDVGIDEDENKQTASVELLKVYRKP